MHEVATPESAAVGHYIAGAKIASSKRTLPLQSPVDGASLGDLAMADAARVNGAVSAAQVAFERWGRTPVKDRVQPLYRFKSLLEKNFLDVAAIISRECGKTREEAVAGVQRGLEVVEYACALPSLLGGEMLEVSSGVDCYTRHFPLGVVAGITPFNFPAMVPMWMFPMAIACGNTFILKPSEQVPQTPLLLAEMLRESRLPDGVFNVVQGDRETVEAIVDHPGIKACAFVGSTPVARQLFQRGSTHGKRMLTLGGAKNHVVIMPDAEPALVARNLAASATGCAGQRCMAASVAFGVGRCENIIDEIAVEMRAIRAGYEMGAVINQKARDRVISYIDAAEQEGAVLVVDGRKPAVPEEKEGGYYVGSTLIDRLRPSSTCAREEIFGPVLSVVRVADLQEAVEIQNRSPYGNAASIYTSSGSVARYFEQNASAGMIGINIGVPVPRDPFSFGGWNDSKFGVGDITGRDSIHFWTQTKKTTVKWVASANRGWMT